MIVHANTYSTFHAFWSEQHLNLRLVQKWTNDVLAKTKCWPIDSWVNIVTKDNGKVLGFYANNTNSDMGRKQKVY